MLNDFRLYIGDIDAVALVYDFDVDIFILKTEVVIVDYVLRSLPGTILPITWLANFTDIVS